MLANRLCFVLTSFSMILCSTAFGELTAEQAVEQTLDQAEALFFMPLKATYQEETYTYYLPSEIVERLSDGKVIVEEESTRTTLIDPATGETKEIFVTREGLYDPTIDMAVRHYAADTVLYLCDKRYRLEQHDAEEGMIGATLWNGKYGPELGTCTRPKIRIGYYRAQAGPVGIVSPLLMAYQRNAIPNTESCALEREGYLYKLTSILRSGSILEYWFDPEKNYIVQRFRFRIGDWVSEESTVTNIVQLADLYLPGDVEYTRYFRDGKVRFNYQASNISWEFVSDIEKKFIIYREERQRLDTYTHREE